MTKWSSVILTVQSPKQILAGIFCFGRENSTCRIYRQRISRTRMWLSFCRQYQNRNTKLCISLRVTSATQTKYAIDFLAKFSPRVTFALQTKSYIHGKFSSGQRLPRGPVITSHSGLIAALSLEIVLKRPDEFKIAELSHIRALFGSKCSQCHQANSDSVTPFYAGFGNRPTDTKSYKQVGKDRRKIHVSHLLFMCYVLSHPYTCRRCDRKDLHR